MRRSHINEFFGNARTRISYCGVFLYLRFMNSSPTVFNISQVLQNLMWICKMFVDDGNIMQYNCIINCLRCKMTDDIVLFSLLYNDIPPYHLSYLLSLHRPDACWDRLLLGQKLKLVWMDGYRHLQCVNH